MRQQRQIILLLFIVIAFVAAISRGCSAPGVTCDSTFTKVGLCEETEEEGVYSWRQTSDCGRGSCICESGFCYCSEPVYRLQEEEVIRCSIAGRYPDIYNNTRSIHCNNPDDIAEICLTCSAGEVYDACGGGCKEATEDDSVNYSCTTIGVNTAINDNEWLYYTCLPDYVMITFCEGEEAFDPKTRKCSAVSKTSCLLPNDDKLYCDGDVTSTSTSIVTTTSISTSTSTVPSTTSTMSSSTLTSSSTDETSITTPATTDTSTVTDSSSITSSSTITTLSTDESSTTSSGTTDSSTASEGSSTTTITPSTTPSTTDSTTITDTTSSSSTSVQTTAGTTQKPEPVCTEIGPMEDPNDCHKYYYCDAYLDKIHSYCIPHYCYDDTQKGCIRGDCVNEKCTKGNFK